MSVETLNFLFALGAVVLQIKIVAWIVFYFLRKKNAFAAKAWDMLGEHGLAYVLVLTLAGMLGSLYYSMIVGYEPCSLCWYQRIFMYPQVLIAAIAIWKRDVLAARYLLALSVVGGLVSLYHYYGQMWNLDALACLGSTVSCAQRYFIEFGYVTMPLLALTLFASAGVAAFAVLRRGK